MSMVVNAATYRKLVQEDLEWIKTVPRTLERDHVIQILERQIRDAERVTTEDRLEQLNSRVSP